MDALDNGFHEVVGIVADVEASAARLGSALGFCRRWEGCSPAAALGLMGLGRGSTAREIVLGHPQGRRGDIRLVQFAGAPGGRMRDGGQAWDPGGIFDINIRALQGIEPLHRAMGLAGFASPAPVTDWDFGPLSVREVVENDADGLAVALMERVSPPLVGYEHVSGPASWVFNSTQVVPDFAAARAFYRDVLGWQPVQETTQRHDSGENCMGLPRGLAPQIEVEIGIYHPHGRMDGSVEIIAFDFAGVDFTAAAPPDRGWAALRFPVSDLDGMVARLRAAGAAVGAIDEFDLAPHGPVRAAAVGTDWGARLELLERV